jgi:hypothetical protein
MVASCTKEAEKARGELFELAAVGQSSVRTSGTHAEPSGMKTPISAEGSSSRKPRRVL